MGLIDHGLNYRQKNQIKRLHLAKAGVDRIVRETGVSPRLVQNCIAAVESNDHINKAPSDSDQFGPLPDTPEWNTLSPGARSGLTRKRQNAEKAG